jgi:hypothetical protein
MSKSSAPHQHAIVLSRIEQALLGAATLALVAMLAFPEARGACATFGWMPFWLVALPLCAWAVARGLRLSAEATLAIRPSARVHRLPVVPPSAHRQTVLSAPRRAA